MSRNFKTKRNWKQQHIQF